MGDKFSNLLLIISDKPDIERDSVAEAWERGGGEVLRLGRFWDPPDLERDRVRVYGSDSFSLVLAQKLRLAMVSPPDDLPVRLDKAWLKRDIRLSPLGDLSNEDLPAFVKPAAPKLFRAGVYDDLGTLRRECEGLEDDTPVLVSEIVEFVAEARCFVLNGKVKTCAVYEGVADTDEAARFIQRMAESTELPASCVIDAGLLAGGGWAVVEANAAWGSGLNGCDPVQAAECIASASRAEPD